MLEHVHDPGAAIAEMARVVRPGAWVCALEWEPDSVAIHPDSPHLDATWRAIYGYQATTGVDPRVGRRLYGLLREAGLVDVKGSTLAWSVTAGEPERLAVYVAGGREIIKQTRAAIVDGGRIGPDVVDRALQEYDRLLVDPATFVSHVFCRAMGVRPRPDAPSA